MCAPKDPTKIWYRHLAISIITILLLVMALGFAITIRNHYNHVLLIHKRVHTKATSNNHWMGFYSAFAVRWAITIGRSEVAVVPHAASTPDLVLFVATSVVEGLAMILLCAALNYQLTHRSRSALYPPNYEAVGVNSPRGPASMPLRGGGHRVYRSPLVRKLLKRGTSILLATELVVFYALLLSQLAVKEQTKLLIYEAFLGVTWIIMVTIWVLMLAIVTDGAEERPNAKAKTVLFIGTAFYTVNALPYEVWSHVLPGCPVVYASWADVLMFVEGISLVFFYLFMREEYLRSKEACLPEKFEQIRRNMNNHRRF